MSDWMLVLVGLVGLVAGPIGVVLFLVATPDTIRFLSGVRERHTAYWVRSGRPWFALTPRPLRGPEERRPPGGPPDQSWPSWRWLFASLCRFPDELQHDPELAALRKRLCGIYGAALICFGAALPLFCMFIWCAFAD